MRTRVKLFAVGVIGLCASVGWSVPSAEPSGDFPLLACGSGRVFTLGAAGDEKPLAVGCGNVHRAVRFGGWTYYANGRLWRVPDGGGKAELVYGGVKHDNVYGFELRPDGTLVIACNAEERLLEFAAPGKDAKLPLDRKDARLDFAVDTTSEDGKPTAAHTRLRMVRTTPAGTFLLGCGTSGMVREYDREGRLVWSHRAGGLAFEAVRLANGNTLVSNLKSLTEVTPDHRKVWSFTPADAPDEKLANFCSIYFLNDGSLLVGTYANGVPDASRATAAIIDPRTKEVLWRYRAWRDRSMITVLPLGPAVALPQEPEGRVRFDFETGIAPGWRVTSGKFPRLVTDRESQYGKRDAPTGKHGRFFLSTLDGLDGGHDDRYSGIIESPTYRLTGPRVTFLIAGGKGASFEAVDRLTGEVVASATGDNSELLKEHAWDLAGSVGREIAFRVRDEASGAWCHLLLDDLSFEGVRVEDDFSLRTEEWGLGASSVSLRAAVKELGEEYPGYPAAAFLRELDEILAPRKEPGLAAGRARAARYDNLRIRALVRENPVVNGCEIAYVTYEQFKRDHHNTATIFQRGEVNEAKYSTEGALRALDPRTGKVRDIVPCVAQRTLRDPEVDYDGRRIVLSARNGKDDDYHVYTVNADGTGYRQLTREKGVSDIDPAWLPDGDIVFSSTRNPKYCMCNRHIMCNLYRMKSDGANIHQIGVSTLFEGHSTVLADGRIMYDRWEYVDRNFGDAQGLWVCNQDGTRHAIYWGNNTTSPGGVINARQMPDGHVIAVLAACHDLPWGALGIIDRTKGVDGREPVLRTWPAWYRDRIHDCGQDFDSPSAVVRRFADPFPLDARHFIAVRKLAASKETELVYLDLHGNEFTFHADAPGIHSPVLLRPSARPPVHPVQRNFEHPNAKGAFLVQDVYVGTHMKGVERGTVKALRVVESPEKRNWTQPSGWVGHGEMAPGMNWHSFENKRILGTVPVEDDGSAYFELPANTFVYFQALDAEGKMVQSMRSGAYVQPGEIFSCVGCHENRVTQAPPPAKAVKAAQRAPSKLDGAYNLRGLERGTPPHLYSFQREVQPVFTRSCVACHDYGKPAGEKLNLSGDYGAYFCASYVDLWALRYIQCIGGGPAPIQPAYSWGSHASKLTKALYGHGGVKLGDDDRDRVITWMDVNAPYYPRYETAYPNNPGGRCPLTKKELARLQALSGVTIANSHGARQREQLDFVRPECSRILSAPALATTAAARAEALAIIAKGKERLAQTPRCDMEGFVPCKKDLEREARYQRRLESERRIYESIREGRRAYDE